MDQLLDKSIARGASRSLLREAERDRLKLVNRMSASLGGFRPVEDESTARAFFIGFKRLQAGKEVFGRVEYAKRHSDVLIFWMDTRAAKKGDVNTAELCAFVVSASSRTINRRIDLGFRVSRHAIERLQQRKSGLLQSLTPVIDEFSLATLSCVSRMYDEHFAKTEKFVLPTPHGLLLCAREDEDSVSGTTWVPLDSLRTEQRMERLDLLYDAGRFLVSMDYPIMRPGTFAGRADRSELHVRGNILRALNGEKTQIIERGIVTGKHEVVNADPGDENATVPAPAKPLRRESRTGVLVP